MRPHKTKKEKRRMAYRKLRRAGIEVRLAKIFRDWTDNKIQMICSGESKPIR